MATKKKPVRRPTAKKKPAARKVAAKKLVARKAVAKKTPAAKKVPAAKKAPAARKASNVAIVSKVPKLPAARRGKGAAPAGRVLRRAVFIDVENTSSEEDLFEVLEALKIDRAVQPTELHAVGNWRAIGQKLGRHLASIGAHLEHSAPATGVRDWSDLWIAVAAGCWLGAAHPGDVLEIVSNDRAFDAVGDAAAARGVIYRRLLHKRGAPAAPAAAEEEDAAPKRRRRSRGGRRRRGRGGSAASTATSAASAAPVVEAAPDEAAPAAPAPRRGSPRPAHRAPTHPPPHEIEPHGATRDQIVSVIGRLSGGDASRWINLDVLEKALKTDGFSRPPGSPRLVTRLRMLRDIEVDSHGRARLSPNAAAAAEPSPAEPDAAVEAAVEEAKPAPAKKRRRRRKPAGGGEGGEAPSAEAASLAAAPYVDPPAE